MTKPTLVVYNKLFEDGDYYITDHINDIGFDRNSLIIHPCPHPSKNPSVWHGIPFNTMLVLPGGECEVCLYCGQKPSEALVTVYKLHNFDKFAGDRREEWVVAPWNTFPRKYPSKIM